MDCFDNFLLISNIYTNFARTQLCKQGIKKESVSTKVSDTIRLYQWFIISITEGDYPSTCVEMLSMEGEPAYQYYMVSEFVQVENTGERFVQNKYFKLHKAISMAPELRHHKREESKKEIVLMANSTAQMKIRSQTRFFYNIEENDGCNKTKVTLYTFGSDDVIDYLLSLGSDVQVLGPSDILNLIRNKVMSMCQDYFEVM